MFSFYIFHENLNLTNNDISYRNIFVKDNNKDLNFVDFRNGTKYKIKNSKYLIKLGDWGTVTKNNEKKACWEIKHVRGLFFFDRLDEITKLKKNVPQSLNQIFIFPKKSERLEFIRKKFNELKTKEIKSFYSIHKKTPPILWFYTSLTDDQINTLKKISEKLTNCNYPIWEHFSEYKVQNGGKKKLKHQFRKHKGIVQTGGKKGKLRKGYRYSGKKLKSGLPQIIKCKSKKC
jgi:hypothetical protein